MENEKKTGNEWAGELMNHLLTIVEESKDHIPEGFQLDGVSLQRYTKGQFNITFSFKS